MLEFFRGNKIAERAVLLPREKRKRGDQRVSEPNQLARFERAVLPHLDAAYNLARWLTRNDHDLTDQGFPLVGGRLDYINDRPVAAVVYRRQQHFINLLIWPSAHGSEKAKTEPAPRQGYHLLRWTTSGMTYWAVSDLNERELKEFVQLAHNQTSPTATP